MDIQDYITAKERLRDLQPKPRGLYRRLLTIFRKKPNSNPKD